MKRAIRVTAAVVLAFIAFLGIAILLGTLLSLVVTFLLRIKIVEIAVRFLITLPISHGWYISESTALSAVIGFFTYPIAWGIAAAILGKVSKDDYLAYLMTGILLSALYIPSGIMDVIAKQPFWADIYGLIAAGAYIKIALDLRKDI